MTDDDSRPRGILTSSDRDLLRGEKELSSRQQYSNRRNTIRNRIANGLLDYSLIWYTLQDRDRKRIFRNPAGESGANNISLTDSLRAMLSWTYLGLKEQNYDFETILVEAIEDAEEDYARKYWGENIDVTVTYNVEVDRSQDIADLISLIEEGGPVPANRLYNLLQLSQGVPINTSELDVVSVWFDSSYPEGEKAVLETIFSEYIGASVEIKDAEGRVETSDFDDAVVDETSTQPGPSVIKNHSLSTDTHKKERNEKSNNDEDKRLRKKTNTDRHRWESALSIALDEISVNKSPLPPVVEDFIDNERLSGEIPTPEVVVEMLRLVSDPFVSSVDIAAVFDSAVEAATQSLEKAQENGDITQQSVRDSTGGYLTIWELKGGHRGHPDALLTYPESQK